MGSPHGNEYRMYERISVCICGERISLPCNQYSPVQHHAQGHLIFCRTQAVLFTGPVFVISRRFDLAGRINRVELLNGSCVLSYMCEISQISLPEALSHHLPTCSRLPSGYSRYAFWVSSSYPATGKPFIFLTSLSILIDSLNLTVSSSSKSPQVESNSFRIVIS